MKKVVIVIPVRMASTRFPGKPLKRIHNKYMLQYVWENAKTSKYGENVYILTSDDIIINAAKKFHANVIKTPNNVKSGTERIASVLEYFNDFDFIFNLQGDEPLFKGKYIDLLVDNFPENEQYVVGTYYYPLNGDYENPNKVKVIFNDRGEAIYFSRSKIPYNGPYYKHIGIYLYRKDFIKTYMSLPMGKLEQSERLEQLRIIEHGYKIYIRELPEDTIGVDTVEDLKRVEEYFNEKK